MPIHHMKACMRRAFPDPRRNVHFVFAIQRFKSHIRVLGELLQKLPFPIFRFALELKASLTFLLLLAVPIGIIKPAVIGVAFLVLINWHCSIFLSSCAGQRVNDWKIFDILSIFVIIYLTREPEGECRSPVPAKLNRNY